MPPKTLTQGCLLANTPIITKRKALWALRVYCERCYYVTPRTARGYTYVARDYITRRGGAGLIRMLEGPLVLTFEVA